MMTTNLQTLSSHSGTITPETSLYQHHVTLQTQTFLSLTIRLYHPSFTTGLLDYILCPYRAVVDRFW